MNTHSGHEGLNELGRVGDEEVKVLVDHVDGHDGVFPNVAMAVFLWGSRELTQLGGEEEGGGRGRRDMSGSEARGVLVRGSFGGSGGLRLGCTRWGVAAAREERSGGGGGAGGSGAWTNEVIPDCVAGSARESAPLRTLSQACDGPNEDHLLL